VPLPAGHLYTVHTGTERGQFRAHWCESPGDDIHCAELVFPACDHIGPVPVDPAAWEMFQPYPADACPVFFVWMKLWTCRRDRQVRRPFVEMPRPAGWPLLDRMDELMEDFNTHLSILRLQNEAIVVNGNDLLAFEPTLKHTITMMKKMAAMLAGGLFNIRLEGTGMLAITSHYEPRTLLVEPGRPVCTDPNATVAWSGNLNPQFRTDTSLRTFLGRGSGESFQMLFEGSGFVVIQPYEEVIARAPGG
jgi:hypothetical protein